MEVVSILCLLLVHICHSYFLVDYLLLVYQGLCNLSLNFTIQLGMS
jgi:hypothetical protein